MKISCILLILFFLSACVALPQQTADSNKTIKFSERIPAELELEVKVKYAGAVGYANLFQGKVVKVVSGIIPDTSVLISVLPGDTAYFIKLKRAHEDVVLNLFFLFNKSGEKYSTAYITGFVDSDKNSWKLIHIAQSKTDY